jgi:predicted enzyme related to lactoylglutathione lyase
VLGRAPYFDQPFYVGFEVGGFELGLVPDGVPGSAGATAYWGTADAHAELARLVALGASVESEVADVGEGIRVATVRDPYGNLFGIIENPHFDKAKVG